MTLEPMHNSPGLPLDASPLLQQLRLFQDQLQQLAATPAQKPPISQEPHQRICEPPTHLAQLQQFSTPQALKGDRARAEQSCHTHASTGVTEQGGRMDMTTPSGAASHEVFRQAMMQRLRAQSQDLSTALSNLNTPESVHTMCATSSYEAWPRQQHIWRDAVAEHLGERVGSPASRALDSIRSALGALPAEPTVASSSAAAPHVGSSRPSTAEDLRLGSSWRPSRFDTCLSGSTVDADINEADRGSTGMLPGIERELNRLLGPKKATAGPSVGSPGMQSTPAAAAAAGPCSVSGSSHDEPGSLARVHSNPLFKEDRDSTAAAGGQDLQALKDGSDYLALREDGQVAGTVGQALNMSVRLVSLGLRPSFSKCCTCLRQACFLCTTAAGQLMASVRSCRGA